VSSDVERNRAWWDGLADWYQEAHGDFIGRGETRWGLWQIPEAELGVLGELEGKDVLELGCGAGQFGETLQARGARVVGIDVSERQLEHARERGVTFELVHGSAEELPFEDARFDLVVCDWGATTFSDPHRYVPEAARVLRPGGVFAFSGGTAIEQVCYSATAQRPERELQRPYFDLHRLDMGDHVEYMLGTGDWIRLFRSSRFEILDLIETRPPAGAESTYRDEYDREWARSWPMEQIWKLRKR
jgi:SAM-dependent methyltransferase